MADQERVADVAPDPPDPLVVLQRVRAARQEEAAARQGGYTLVDCGYGDAASDVPMEIRIAIRSLIAANYAMRESHFFMQGGVVSSTGSDGSVLSAKVAGLPTELQMC